MADQKTEACFLIPCSPTQAAAIMDAFEGYNALEDNRDTVTEHEHPLTTPIVDDSLSARIIAAILEVHPDKQDHLDIPPLDFDANIEDTGVCIHSSYMNLNHASIVTQVILRECDITAPVVINAIRRSSPLRIGTQSAVDIVVSKESITEFDTRHSIDATIKAIQRGERYYFCEMMEKASGCEYPSKFITILAKDDDESAAFERIEKEFWRENGGEHWIESWDEITPEEFRILSARINTIPLPQLSFRKNENDNHI